MLKAISLLMLALGSGSQLSLSEASNAAGAPTTASTTATEITAGIVWVVQASNPKWLDSRFNALWSTAENGDQFVHLVPPATGSLLTYPATIRGDKAYIGNPNSQYVVLTLIPHRDPRG